MSFLLAKVLLQTGQLDDLFSWLVLMCSTRYASFTTTRQMGHGTRKGPTQHAKEIISQASFEGCFAFKLLARVGPYHSHVAADYVS